MPPLCFVFYRFLRGRGRFLRLFLYTRVTLAGLPLPSVPSGRLWRKDRKAFRPWRTPGSPAAMPPLMELAGIVFD